MSLIYQYLIKRMNGDIKSLPESSVFRNIRTPQYICYRGSLTVEAAVILPFMAGFFACILFFFRVMQVQLAVQEALEDTGRILAIVSERELEGEEIPEYYALAKASVFAKLSDDENVKQYVVGEALGVTLLESEWEKDYLELEANYAMKIPINLFGRRYLWIAQKASFRKWTGWHSIDISVPQAVSVFVTKNGTAYHRSKSCPYLSLSTREVQLSEVEGLRNAERSKYKECGACKKEGIEMGTVYITDYGERYHYRLTCKGLKRIIYEKKLSEVGGKDACRKCWK